MNRCFGCFWITYSTWTIISYARECPSNLAHVFGVDSNNYKIYYVKPENEEFFNVLFESKAKELIYKAQYTLAHGWANEGAVESIFSTKCFIVIDQVEQIPLIEAANIISFCIPQPDGTVKYMEGEKL